MGEAPCPAFAVMFRRVTLPSSLPRPCRTLGCRCYSSSNCCHVFAILDNVKAPSSLPELVSASELPHTFGPLVLCPGKACSPRVRKYSCSARPQALAAVDISPAVPAIRPFHTSGFAGSLGAGPLFLVQLQILTRTLHVRRCEVKISNTIAGCALQCNGTTRGVNLDLAVH